MPKFIINDAPAPAPAAALALFENAATPNISDNLSRLQGPVGLRKFHGSKRLLGTAFTVKVRPGDNLFIYKAISMLSPGHVLVIDGSGDVTSALVGELLMLAARRQGCVGFVVEGAVRDVEAFAAADFPCYARGESHRGPYKSGPGHINVPVAIGGQVVLPGDIVVGDADGIVTFPAAIAAQLADEMRTTCATEEWIKAQIAATGKGRAWMEKVLSDNGL